MEDPLLGRGGSSGDHRSREGHLGEKATHFFGRASAIAKGNRFQKAAALVDLAEDGEGIPSEVLNQENPELATRLYFIYTSLRVVWGLNLTAIILLNFFEVPLWCKGDFPDPCGSKEKFFLGELPYLSRWESLSFEIVTLVILLVHSLFPILFMGSKLYWDKLHIFKVTLIVLLIVDTVLNTIYVSPSGAISTLPFRMAPYIRVCIVAVNIPDVRYSIKTFAGILPDFTDVAALTLLFLLFWSWLAYVLFEDTVQGTEVFTSYLQTLYEMTVLFTTSNNPFVWLPAYKQSRFSSLFFILYILIGVFFITNLVLAVVYDSFKGQLAEYLVGQAQTRTDILDSTFDLLDEEKKGSLDLHQCSQLFKELNHYRTLPKISDDDMEAVFYALDDSGDFRINREEFSDLCGAISLKFDKSDVSSVLEANFPEFYESYYFLQLRKFVRSKTFDNIIIGMLMLNLITVIIETTLDLEDDVSQSVWQAVELSFGWVYLLELFMKVTVYGFTNYWRSGTNRFDFFITWVIVIAETLAFSLPNGLPYLRNSEWIRYLMIARLLRLVRVLMLLERFRVKLTTFMNLIPNLLPYLGINFFLMCIYCTIGIQTFGGLVYEGNPKLVGTAMEESDYFVHNFNDYPSGMVTLFNLLVMGDWQVWLETYAVLSSQWWAVVYFMSFYVIAVLFLLNLIVAFVLEAFFAEIDIAEELKQVDMEEESAPKSEKARLRAKRGKDNRVQNLLNHMLSAEMEKSKTMPAHDHSVHGGQDH